MPRPPVQHRGGDHGGEHPPRDRGRGTRSSCSPACRPGEVVTGLRHLSTPRASGATSSRSSYARQFLARWTSPTSTSSRACRRRSRSTRRAPAATRPRWARSPNLRLPAPPLRPHRVPTARTTAPSSPARPQQIVDRILELPEGTRVPGAGARGAGPQGQLRSTLLADLAPRASPGPGSTASHTSSPDARRARPLRDPHDRGGRRPPGAPRGTSASPHRLARETARSPGRGRGPRSRLVQGGRRGRSRSSASHLSPAGAALPTTSRPWNFSFNSPCTAPARCDGLGTMFEVDPELVVPNPTEAGDRRGRHLSPWASGHNQYHRLLGSVAAARPSPSTCRTADLND